MTEDNTAPTIKPFKSAVLGLSDDELEKKMNGTDEKKPDPAPDSEPVKTTEASQKQAPSENPLADILDDQDVLKSSKIHMTLRSLAKTYATLATKKQPAVDFSQVAEKILENDNKVRLEFRKLLIQRAYEMQKASDLVIRDIEKNNGHGVDKIIGSAGVAKSEHLLNILTKKD